MTFKSKKDLESITRPYKFILKEGENINEDPFDFTLMMMQWNNVETFRSPSSPYPPAPPVILSTVDAPTTAPKSIPEN